MPFLATSVEGRMTLLHVKANFWFLRKSIEISQFYIRAKGRVSKNRKTVFTGSNLSSAVERKRKQYLLNSRLNEAKRTYLRLEASPNDDKHFQKSSVNEFDELRSTRYRH